MNTSHPRKQVRFIWVDQTVTEEENTQIRNHLKDQGISIEAFETIENANGAIQNADVNDEIHLISSGSYSQDLVTSLHEKQNIAEIIIFCLSPEFFQDWAKQYKKVKRIMTEARELKSYFEAYGRRKLLENSASPFSADNPQLYKLKDLIMAGELQYNEKKMKTIASDINEKFADRMQRDFLEFLDEVLRVIMYLLKRELNLKELIEELCTSCEEEGLEQIITLRYLVDELMRRSNPYLHHRFYKLLCKRNVVPMVQPSLDSNASEHRFVAHALSIWDFQVPMLLSFGIDKVDGKSKLLNTLFLTSFERSANDKYFDGTIDLDFGHQFHERRRFNIADHHGRMSQKRLEQISGMFSGFLIHVDFRFLSDNEEYVLCYLKLLDQNRYIHLIVRDTTKDKQKMKSLETKLLSTMTNLKLDFLPNCTDLWINVVSKAIEKLRDSIFEQAETSQVVEECEIRKIFVSLLSETERNDMKAMEDFVKGTTDVLINGSIEKFPMYERFEDFSKKKLEITKKDPYKNNFHDETISKLHREFYEAHHALKEYQADKEKRGEAFERFFGLFQDEASRSKNISLLAIELQKKREKLTQQQREISFAERLSIDIHWRNIFLCFENMNDHEKRLAFNTYRDYILDGNPFEIIDGDNFQMQSDFMEKIFESLGDKKIFVLTVIGPQNSGKSTLFNFLFGTSFEARDGRCTKGMYGTLVDVSRVNAENNLTSLPYDYILVIDTEGIVSPEKSDDEYSKKLLLFSLAVSHLLVINKEGEIDEPLKKLIILCVQSLQYIKEARVKNPCVHIVLNKRDNINPEKCRTLLATVMSELEKNGLQNMISVENNIHELKNAFIKAQINVHGKNQTSYSIDEDFLMGAQKLGRLFINQSDEVMKGNDDRFRVPSKWVKHAGQVFRAIEQHPDIAKFQEVYEREQLQKLYTKAKKEFKELLSETECQTMIDTYKKKQEPTLEALFDTKLSEITALFCEALEKYRKDSDLKLSDEVYKHKLDLFKLAIKTRIQSIHVSTMLASERYKMNELMNKAEKEIREMLNKMTIEECHSDENSARSFLTQKLNSSISTYLAQLDRKKLWENSRKIVSFLPLLFDTEYIPAASDFIKQSERLESLDTQSGDLDYFLSEISQNFIKLVSGTDCLVSELKQDCTIILPSVFDEPREYLDSKFLKEISTNSPLTRNRRLITRRGENRSDFFEKFEENRRKIFKVDEFFKKLSGQLKEIFHEFTGHDDNAAFQLGEKTLSLGLDFLKKVNSELNPFSYQLSQDFCRLIITFITVSMTAHYYVRQREEQIKFPLQLKEKIAKLIDQFVPVILLKDNEDAKSAMVIIESLSNVAFNLSKQEVEKRIPEILEQNKQTLAKRFIIEHLDKAIADNNNKMVEAEILKYLLEPLEVIKEEFDKNWEKIIHLSKNVQQLTDKSWLETLHDTFKLIEKMNKQLQEEGSKITFLDKLFIIDDTNMNYETCQQYKQRAMKNILYLHLTGTSVPSSIVVDQKNCQVSGDIWSGIVANCKPNDAVSKLFSLLKDDWDKIKIVYPVKFLEEITRSINKTEEDVRTKIEDLTRALWTKHRHIYKQNLDRCREMCPCCKRLCDFDHLDNIRYGEKGNEHRCELGHQFRAIAGYYYEMNGEAMLGSCGTLSDNHVLKIENQKRFWKDYKNMHNDWLFSSDHNQSTQANIHRVIWHRVGNMICDFYKRDKKYPMKFVTSNSPLPINHLIFVLDHSGSMTAGSLFQWTKSFFTRSSQPNSNHQNSENLTPWQELRVAFEKFIDVRKQLYSFTDQITVVAFGSQAVTVFKRKPLCDVNLNDFDEKLRSTGSSTNYKVALDMVLGILQELQTEERSELLQNSIIFMTDGEPTESGDQTLKRLTEYKKEINPALKSFIHRFWTIGFGSFNRSELEKMNKIMNGQLVSIDQANQLSAEFIHIAEICPTN